MPRPLLVGRWTPVAPAVNALLPSPPLNSPPRASFSGPAPARPTSASKTSPTPARTHAGSQSPTGHAHLLAPPLADPQATRPRPLPDPNSHDGPAPLDSTHAALQLWLRPRPLHLGGAGAGSGCQCWRRWLRLRGGGRGRVRAAATSWADPSVRGVTRGESRSECDSPPVGLRVRFDRLGWGPHEAGSSSLSRAAGSSGFPAPRWLRWLPERRRAGRGAQSGASEGAIW